MCLNDLMTKDLSKVVSQLTPPAGKVAYISNGNKKIVKIHAGDETEPDIQVTYIVTERELPQVQEKLLRPVLTNVALVTSEQVVQEQKLRRPIECLDKVQSPMNWLVKLAEMRRMEGRKKVMEREIIQMPVMRKITPGMNMLML